VSAKTTRSNESTTKSAEFSDERSIPLGVGETAEESPLESMGAAKPKRRVSGGVVILVAVVLVAVAGLFFMRTLTKVSNVAVGDNEIEKQIVRFLDNVSEKNTKGQPVNSVLMRNDDEVLKLLNAAYSERQVPLENVQRDPFMLFDEDIVAAAPTEDGIDPASAMAELRRQKTAEIEKSAEAFALKSVMMGDSPLANVDGKILRVGDSLQSQDGKNDYTLTTVTPTSATLTSTVPALSLTVDIVLRVKRGG